MPSSIHPTIASGNLPRISANLLNRLIGDKTGKFKEEKLLGSRQQCVVYGDWRQDGEIERRKTADSSVLCGHSGHSGRASAETPVHCLSLSPGSFFSLDFFPFSVGLASN